MNKIILTKFICMQEIWVNQNMNIWLKDAWIKYLNNPNAFIECSNTMDDVYENINDYNTIRKRKKIIVFGDMVADIMDNKQFQVIIKELFIRCKKINISLIFITQSYFSVAKDIRLNLTH